MDEPGTGTRHGPAHPAATAHPATSPAVLADPAAPDRGSGSVHAVTLAMVLGVLLVTVLLLAQAAVATTRAGRAADLAALAAADTARGLVAGDPCTAARSAAADNGAELELCRLVPPELVVVDVRTSVSLAGPLAPYGPARAVARAGPPGAP